MKEAARFIEVQTSVRPKVGVVLGSGLGSFADSLANGVRIPYSEIPQFPVSTVFGHAGELVMGTIGANGRAAADVVVMSGRFHLYEGYTAQQVTAGIRLFRELGVDRLVLTNASGGIKADFTPGTLVSLSDHINLLGANPLRGPNADELGPRFPDMTEAYSPQLRAIAQETASVLRLPLPEGVYAAVLGPSYETPAEIRYLRAIGADLVGMSTVLETIAARHMGMRVLGLSCVTNIAAGLGGKNISHDEVLAVGRQVSSTFLRLLNALVPRLASA